MAAIRTGKLKYLAGEYHSGQWEDCELSLFSDATISVDYAGTKQKIGMGLFGTALPLLTPVACAFIIQQNEGESTEFSGGPIFVANTEEERYQWIASISETIVKHKIASKHEHPLPPVGVQRMATKCSTCHQSYPYVLYHDCEYCEDYMLCSSCYNTFYNLPCYPVVTSATHPHQLVRPELIIAQDEIVGSSRPPKPECSRCYAKCTGYYYACSQCPGYFECSTCAYELLHNTETTRAKQMQLDLGNLDHVIHTTAPNTYVVDTTGKRSPSQMSVVSQQHWDLSRIDEEPVNSAYFEVTFTKISGTVGVGIGNQIFTQNRLLGQQQNSYGYLSDGKLFVSDKENSEGLEFPSINEGDTIGAGILLDSFNLRRLYFTKNGKMLGCFPGRVHRGMDCFPGVSFSKQGAEFIVNMSGPFKFDVENNIVNYRHDKQDRLKTLPEELISEIITYASYRPELLNHWDSSPSVTIPCHEFASECRLVSKMFKRASDDNSLWRTLFRWCFPNAYHDVKVKSWKQLYKARYLAIDYHSDSSHPIENCEFEFKCPILWEKLTKSSNDTERHCNKCDKTVYEVSDRETLNRYAKMGRCVSVVIRDDDDPYGEERYGGEAPQAPRHIPWQF